MMNDTLKEYVGKTVLIKYAEFKTRSYVDTSAIGKISEYDNLFIKLNPFVNVDGFTHEVSGTRRQVPREEVVKVIDKIKAGTDKHEKILGKGIVRSIELLV